jgi:hypothetical protein
MLTRMALAASLLLCGATWAQQGLWATPEEILALPASGAAWESVASSARALSPLDLSDQDDPNDSRLLAAAMVAIRTGGDVAGVRALILDAMGTEDGGRTLALGRNLPCLVFAADLVGLPPADNVRFKAWLHAVIRENLDGRTIISTHEDRPNNWGTWAGAARVAASAYIEDWADVRTAARVTAGWMGYPRAYAGFSWGDLDWQGGPAPLGINLPGARLQGHSVDGVLPDDQRRGGAFEWPPPCENYVWEALQGVVTELVVLDRLGLDMWTLRSSAPLRAVRWLHIEANCPAEGDDTWIPHVINKRYDRNFPAPIPSRHGKGPGFADWHNPIR